MCSHIFFFFIQFVKNYPYVIYCDIIYEGIGLIYMDFYVLIYAICDIICRFAFSVADTVCSEIGLSSEITALF